MGWAQPSIGRDECRGFLWGNHRDGVPWANFLAEKTANTARLVDDAGRVERRQFRARLFIDAVDRADRNADFAAGATIRIDDSLRAAFTRRGCRGGHR